MHYSDILWCLKIKFNFQTQWTADGPYGMIGARVPRRVQPGLNQGQGHVLIRFQPTEAPIALEIVRKRYRVQTHKNAQVYVKQENASEKNWRRKGIWIEISNKFAVTKVYLQRTWKEGVFVLF